MTLSPFSPSFFSSFLSYFLSWFTFPPGSGFLFKNVEPEKTGVREKGRRKKERKKKGKETECPFKLETKLEKKTWQEKVFSFFLLFLLFFSPSPFLLEHIWKEFLETYQELTTPSLANSWYLEFQQGTVNKLWLRSVTLPWILLGWKQTQIGCSFLHLLILILRFTL